MATTTTGDTAPGTAADDSAVGTVPWTNPSNAKASDNSYATTTDPGTAATTHYLKVTNFGFALPTSATVLGVVVKIERHQVNNDAASDLKDSAVKLVKGGSATGSNKAAAASWPTSDGVASYGSTSDLWGTTLSPADVNDSTFGAALSVQIFLGDVSQNTPAVDLITISVTYSTLDSAGSPLAAVTRRHVGGAVCRRSVARRG